MIYYKILDDSSFIGVGTSKELRKHQKKHNLLISASESEAQYLATNEAAYWDVWMQEPPTDEIPYKVATIQAISEEEYNALLKAMETGQEINIDDAEEYAVEEEPADEIPETREEELTADFVREVKIREMSLACNKAITDGFDLTLGNSKKHFSLSLKDQANLASATAQILTGATEIPYHADGDEFRNYSADEMLKIIGAANEHKTFHLAYYNCLKKWLNGVSRITSIQAVEYGVDIPKKYQSTFLKSLYEG